MLYTKAKDLGITVFTISHRSSLFKFHDYYLKFEGDGIWSFNSLNEDEKNMNNENSKNLLRFTSAKENVLIDAFKEGKLDVKPMSLIRDLEMNSEKITEEIEISYKPELNNPQINEEPTQNSEASDLDAVNSVLKSDNGITNTNSNINTNNLINESTEITEKKQSNTQEEQL